MTKKHNCETCKYETVVHSNYLKHLKTKTHLNKLAEANLLQTHKHNTPVCKISTRKGVFKCEYCSKVLSYKYHLTRHYMVCKDKEITEMENDKDSIIKRLQDENTQLIKEKELAFNTIKEMTKLKNNVVYNYLAELNELTKLKENAEYNYLTELKEFSEGVKLGYITVNSI